MKEFEQDWLVNHVKPQVLEDLSVSLLVGDAGLSSTATANERRAAGERFLAAMKNAWLDHQLCMGMTSDVLMYMVRSEVKPYRYITDWARNGSTV